MKPESNAIKERAKAFNQLSDKEQVGVLNKADERARLFPRIYAAYRKVLEMLSPKSRSERYQAFLAENPYVQDDKKLAKNLYVPLQEGQASMDREIELSTASADMTDAASNAGPTTLPIDQVIADLEQGLTQLEQSMAA